jgi:general secretion pathway protein G
MFEDKNLVEQGFTLIELLVVIVILGVLAAVVVFAVNGITDRGHSSACKSEVATINTAVQAYYAKKEPNPAYPAGPLASLGSQLIAAGLLSSSSVVPGATTGYTPAYDAATGNFTAACP